LSVEIFAVLPCLFLREGIVRVAELVAGVSLMVGVALCGAQMQMGDMADHRPVTLVAGLGNSHHSIRTNNPEAQRFFDQGMDYLFAFNHDEARRSFARAAELDPKTAMPWWGVALAVGPNYNDIDIGHARAKQAVDAIARAKALAVGGPAVERDYVDALAQRYSSDLQTMGREYAAAMKGMVGKYPDDLDAATLYAESLMDLHPWQLWSADGRPTEGTEEIVATLKGVLARDPNHVGANHFLIHAVEASGDPSMGLASARRLEKLAPAAGHLVHMPSHIYQRVGDFDASATSNVQAMAADAAYVKSEHLEDVATMYNVMYLTHNIHFLAAACMMEGRSACAVETADRLVKHVGPEVATNKMVEWFLPTQPWVLVRFGKWEEILSAPAPPKEMAVLGAMWHYARGSAYAGLGRLKEAHAERETLASAIAALPADTPADFNNSVKTVMGLALTVLDARIAEASGDREKAIGLWRKSVAEWDTLAYNEPADWYYPVRESLGGALLRAGKASEAEAVFRRDLEINPRSGRSLFGLWQSLVAQKRDADGEWVKKQFDAAWARADVELSVGSL
jgi:tetratricopeptide (TPR) repeat protein